MRFATFTQPSGIAAARGALSHGPASSATLAFTAARRRHRLDRSGWACPPR